ncbi:hypothetical protein LJ737_20625 [Hymenobacter sp. 15J16-1T3B]|nr:hypothetical protein [Hymenobacter sp. 15J16-1T3B]MCC3159658.1 hypothetical protein [Hymenobacter sp. 15J16-1T3B]
MPDFEYFDLYGEWPVYSRAGFLQFRFLGYSASYCRLKSLHRKRPYRAL